MALLRCRLPSSATFEDRVDNLARTPQEAGGKHILVVDDKIESRRSLAGLLRLLGYVVYESADADQALVLLGSPLAVHCVITDVNMPGTMDGIALAQHLRLTYRDMLVVVHSASDIRTGLDDPAVLFLRKPYRPERLVDHLRQHLGASA
jgi:CheY-like chemotaxis protein